MATAWGNHYNRLLRIHNDIGAEKPGCSHNWDRTIITATVRKLQPQSRATATKLTSPETARPLQLELMQG